MHPRGRTWRRIFVIGLLTVLGVLVLGACGEGEKGAKARPLPEDQEVLQPGLYRSEEFEPSFTFRVGKGWTADLEMSEALAISQGEDVEGERALLGFANVKELYEPGTLDVTNAPKSMVDWFQHHPYLRTTKPQPVTVGGIKGVRFDVFVDDPPKDYYGICGSGCVDLFEFGNGHIHVIFEGEKQRVTVLGDVRGEQVTIVFASMPTKFDKVWPEARKVIDSVRWKDT